MSVSPVSASPSAAQLALQQIRALRQASPAQPQNPPSTARIEPPKPRQTQAQAQTQALNQPIPNRPRGSIINIVA